MTAVALPKEGRAADPIAQLVRRATAEVERVILGKPQQVRQCIACLLARGHLLIEDVPGVGKTMLANALARTLGLSYQRIQFTSDLLPADIIGASIFERATGEFRFQPGPLFAQVVLADEVNRATPKTQSALLEAMEEHQVTVDGQTRKLPEPFFVIATQNPAYQIGTFPLPESQLDRFLLRVALGFPDAAAERELLKSEPRKPGRSPRAATRCCPRTCRRCSAPWSATASGCAPSAASPRAWTWRCASRTRSPCRETSPAAYGGCPLLTKGA